MSPESKLPIHRVTVKLPVRHDQVWAIRFDRIQHRLHRKTLRATEQLHSTLPPCSSVDRKPLAK